MSAPKLCLNCGKVEDARIHRAKITHGYHKFQDATKLEPTKCWNCGHKPVSHEGWGTAGVYAECLEEGCKCRVLSFSPPTPVAPNETAWERPWITMVIDGVEKLVLEDGSEYWGYYEQSVKYAAEEFETIFQAGLGAGSQRVQQLEAEVERLKMGR